MYYDIDISTHNELDTLFDLFMMITEENARALSVEAMATTNKETIDLLNNRESLLYFG